MLALDLGVGRADVVEAMCSDTRELRGARIAEPVELDGLGNRFVTLVLGVDDEAWGGGVSLAALAGSGFVT